MQHVTTGTVAKHYYERYVVFMLPTSSQNEPVHEILVLIASTSSQGSDESMHLCSLARASVHKV